ncbi:MAG: hypothetical protein KA248_15065 [Kiritimatiellae bacterium]|nr:hypothetical protein [Kiritimatiellia bacterium]
MKNPVLRPPVRLVDYPKLGRVLASGLKTSRYGERFIEQIQKLIPAASQPSVNTLYLAVRFARLFTTEEVRRMDKLQWSKRQVEKNRGVMWSSCSGWLDPRWRRKSGRRTGRKSGGR